MRTVYPGNERFLAVPLAGLAFLVCACSSAASQTEAPPARLEIPDARGLIQEYWTDVYPEYLSPSGFRITEITAAEVWDNLHFQLYSLDGNYTFLIRDGRASLFHQGVFGGGVADMLVDTVGGAGHPILIYTSEVSLSGVYHGCVSLAYEADGVLIQVPVVAGFLQTFELERSASGKIEIIAGGSVIGSLRLRESEDEVEGEIVFDTSLPADIREAFTRSGLACGMGAARDEE